MTADDMWYGLMFFFGIASGWAVIAGFSQRCLIFLSVFFMKFSFFLLSVLFFIPTTFAVPLVVSPSSSKLHHKAVVSASVPVSVSALPAPVVPILAPVNHAVTCTYKHYLNPANKHKMVQKTCTHK